MNDSKLIYALKCLKRKEFKRFGTFLSSPFFNTNSKVINLYKLLCMSYPAFKKVTTDKKFIFSLLYPGIGYNDGTMRNLISDFTKLFHRYLAELNFEKDEYDMFSRSLYELDYRKIDNNFKSTVKQYEKHLSQRYNLGYSYFYNIRKLLEAKVDFALKRGEQKQISSKILIRSEVSAYDFIIYTLSEVQNLKINETAYNAKYKHNLAEYIIGRIDFDIVLKTIENSTPEYSDIFKLFLFEGLAFLRLENDKYYFEFKDLFFRYYDNLSYSAKDNMFISLENTCIEKKFMGKRQFITEELNLYKERIKRKLYKDETNEFNVYLFRNITLSAIACSEIEWLKNFIKQYSSELDDKFRIDMINFAEGFIFFEQCLYGKALKSVSKVVDPANIYKISIYTLKLKIYFELNDIETLWYFLDSYAHFIASNKEVSERFRQSNKYFIKLITKLIKIKAGEINRSELINLKKILLSKQYIKEQSWLLNKVDELS